MLPESVFIVKVGRVFFGKLFFYKNIKCEGSTKAKEVLSKELDCGHLGITEFSNIIHSNSSPRTFIINGKKYVRCIKL